MTEYFDPISIGNLEFSNRVWMAPMTRARASAGGVPTSIMAEYYGQRAGAGLIVSEGTYVNDHTCAFEHAPGIYSEEQVEAWKPVTQAVHDAGGKIFVQLWHCGRVGSRSTLGGRDPLSPSGLNSDLDKVDVWALLGNGSYTKIVASPSRQMTLEEVKSTIVDFGVAAKNAKLAGFDGVEIHAANGYLPHQFLSPALNRREDEYGGSVENRARFISEIFEALEEHYPAQQIGVRLSPIVDYNNTRDPDPEETFSHLARCLNAKNAGYLHVADQNGWGGEPEMDRILSILRPNFDGVIVANGAVSLEQGKALLAGGRAQVISFGRGYFANPDFDTRVRDGAQIAEPRDIGWYAAGEEGYTDYPAMS